MDAPDFNLRLASKLHAMGVPVVYYISPQVWAWRRGRVKKMARLIDKMLVLFPFEKPFYEENGLQCVHVGHPLVDEVPVLESVWEQETGLPETPRVALMPGSRNSEVEALLPEMLRGVAALGAVSASLILAPSVNRERVERLIFESVGSQREVELFEGDRFERISESHAVLCASGTATLEVGLLETPLVVVYRVAPATYQLAKRLVKIDHVALVNLVLEERVAPELIQSEASAKSIAKELSALLGDRARIDAQRGRLKMLRAALGDSGASERAAQAVLETLKEHAA